MPRSTQHGGLAQIRVLCESAVFSKGVTTELGMSGISRASSTHHREARRAGLEVQALRLFHFFENLQTYNAGPRLLLRPDLCAMQNAVDFNDILADAVDSQKGQARKYQFAGVQLAARTAAVRKLREGTYALVDCECHTPSRCRALMFLDVVTNVCEVAGSGLCPANAH